MSENFNYLQALLITVAASSIIYFFLPFFLLSIVNDSGAWVTFDSSLSRLTLIGLVAGVIHGSITGFFLIWWKNYSITNVLTASVFAAIIISLIICLGLWTLNKYYLLNDGETEYSVLIIGYLKVFFYATICLSIPALLSGILMRLGLTIFRGLKFLS